MVIKERFKDKEYRSMDELRGAALSATLRTEKDHDKLGAEALMNKEFST